jgi:acyl-CoA thioester hydrolase
MLKMPTDGLRPRAETPLLSEFPVWLEINTRNQDTDQFGHVNHAAMATLFEEARIALIFSPELRAETAAVDLLVVKLTMNFHKELKAPGFVRVGSNVTRIGASSLDIRQAIFASGACFASAEAVCVLLGKESRRPTRVSDGIRHQLLDGSNAR